MLEPPLRSAPLDGIGACVFDAYGTLFDVASVAQGARDALAAHGVDVAAFSDLWRTRQLQYTWLRGLAGRHADFWQVTGDALDYALDAHGLADAPLRARLMDLYLRIGAYAEVPRVLQRLRAGGLPLAILSNGTPAMLAAALRNAGLEGLFAAVLSVEEAGVYKPHPHVYDLAPRHLGLPREAICFVSSNGWDAWSAQAYGLRVLWCNRTRQRPERLPQAPEGQLPDLAALPALLLPAQGSTAQGIIQGSR